MAKKFFYNRVYNTKRMIINAIIIGVCVIGVIVCFIITSNFQGESHETNANLTIKGEATMEINQEFSKELFFSKVENVNLDDIEIKYPLELDTTKVGKYEFTIIVNEESYTSILNVVDTTKPELALKDVKIDKNGTYKASQFVSKCSDNSKENCIITFYSSGVDQDGNSIDYSKFKNEGTYTVKVSAKDTSGNETVKEATLTIGKGSNNGSEGENNNTDKPNVTCKYGDNSYDTTKYLVAVDITTNKCAVSLDLYKDETMTKEINKIMDTETTKIKKDVEALKLTGTLALNRKITAVTNLSGNGVVGYELQMVVTLTNDGKVETIAEYKVTNSGKRIFTINPHNLTS